MSPQKAQTHTCSFLFCHHHPVLTLFLVDVQSLRQTFSKHVTTLFLGNVQSLRRTFSKSVSHWQRWGGWSGSKALMWRWSAARHHPSVPFQDSMDSAKVVGDLAISFTLHSSHLEIRNQTHWSVLTYSTRWQKVKSLIKMTGMKSFLLLS